MSYIGNEPIVSATRTVTEITATAGQTTFTANGGYTVGYIDVFVNGAQLQTSDFTASDGSSVVLAQAAQAGDDVRLVAWGTFQASTALNANNPSYTGTLTGGTGVVNLGSGQFYKDASGNIGLGATGSLTGGSRKALIVNAPSGQLSILELGVNGTIQGYLYASASQATLNSQGIPLTFETNGGERMRIDTSGRVTMPFQPAFGAYMSSNPTMPSVTAWKFPLDATDFNDGSHFNTSTNRFTAPVAGRYLFTAAAQYQTGGQVHVNLYVNGGAVNEGWIDFGNGTAATQSRILKLNAGDFVEMYGYNTSSSVMSGTRCRMTGVLLG